MTNPINIHAATIINSARKALRGCASVQAREFKDARQLADAALLLLQHAIRDDRHTCRDFATALTNVGEYQTLFAKRARNERSAKIAEAVLDLVSVAAELAPPADLVDEPEGPRHSAERKALHEVAMFIHGEHAASIEEIANVTGSISEAKRLTEKLDGFGVICLERNENGDWWQMWNITCDDYSAEEASVEISKALDAHRVD